MLLKSFNYIILSVLLSLSMLFAQATDATLFKDGINFYKNNQYDKAQRTFIQILKDFPNSDLQTATKLMLAKSFYKLGDYKSSRLVVDNFIKNYRFSDYLDDIYFLKGKIDFRQRDYESAVNNWLWIIYNESDARLKKKAGEFVFYTMEDYLTEKEISNLSDRYPDDTFRGLVEIVKAQKLIDAGETEEGEQILKQFIADYPYHIYADVAKRLLRGETGASASSNRILILESGENSSKAVNQAIAKGFYYAAYEMSERDRNKVVQIDTLTLDQDPLPAIQKALPVLDKYQPLAVLGPVEDVDNTVFTLLSKYESFPYISPVSSQKGLAAISPYTFQINPDAEIKGKYLANYAVHDLKFKTFAILAPADPYGQAMVKGFEETVQDSGREVVEKQWYYEDTQDFSRQLKTIRKKGFYIVFRDSVLTADSLLTDEEIQEQFKQYLTETLFSDESRHEIDSTQVPSTGIDALFIITYPEYVPFIGPQFAFQNIRTTLLGNEGWNVPDQLIQQRVYLDGLIFISPGYFDPESWNYRTFLSRFRQQMQTTPDKYHLLGYDIGKWMLTYYRPGMSRQEFRDVLAASGKYEGILENIKFGLKPRVNSELNIIRFYLGQFLKVK
jgi:ABC-type branched-subunit amino acid transport system substrate-binding protein